MTIGLHATILQDVDGTYLNIGIPFFTIIIQLSHVKTDQKKLPQPTGRAFDDSYAYAQGFAAWRRAGK